MYLTHPLTVMDSCDKYGKPMSKQKNARGQTWICTQTDRQSDSYIPLWTSFMGGINSSLINTSLSLPIIIINRRARGGLVLKILVYPLKWNKENCCKILNWKVQSIDGSRHAFYEHFSNIKLSCDLPIFRMMRSRQ